MSAGVNLSVKVENGEAIDRPLVGLQLRMRDLRPVLREMGAALLTSSQRRFEDEQAPSGVPWAPIQRAGSILRDSGRLSQSLTYTMAQSQLAVGTNVLYVRIHQLGGKAGRGRKTTIAPRPYLGLDDADHRELRDIINDYAREALP